MSSLLMPLEVRERHVISSGTPITGGVLLSRAGIVVDVAENPAPYRAILAEVDEELAWKVEWGEQKTTLNVLKAVDRIAKQRVPFGPSVYEGALKAEARRLGVERLTQEHHIGLSNFLPEDGLKRGGNCQHYASLAGALIEMLQQRGDIEGGVSLESGRPGPLHPDRHVYITFANDEGEFLLQINSPGVHKCLDLRS